MITCRGHQSQKEVAAADSSLLVFSHFFSLAFLYISMARSHNNGYQSMLSSQFSTSPSSYHSTTHDTLLRNAHEESNGAMAYHEEQRTGQVATRSSSNDTLHALSKGQGYKSDSEDSDNEMQTAERRPLLNSSHHSNNNNRDVNNKQKHHQQQPHSTLMQVLHDILGEITGSEYLENSGSVARDHLGK